uniref:Uncharacterized protein n=1 Tax=Anguilla anguilla TaxID=7936 RepID=A0A0E9V7R4_ANGAN
MGVSENPLLEWEGVQGALLLQSGVVEQVCRNFNHVL